MESVELYLRGARQKAAGFTPAVVCSRGEESRYASAADNKKDG